MLKLTHIYKTEKAGLRQSHAACATCSIPPLKWGQNQKVLLINLKDPKFFFTLTAKKPTKFKAELIINEKTEFYLFEIHERQLNRGIDYAFPIDKLPRGEGFAHKVKK